MVDAFNLLASFVVRDRAGASMARAGRTFLWERSDLGRQGTIDLPASVAVRALVTLEGPRGRVPVTLPWAS